MQPAVTCTPRWIPPHLHLHQPPRASPPNQTAEPRSFRHNQKQPRRLMDPQKTPELVLLPTRSCMYPRGHRIPWFWRKRRVQLGTTTRVSRVQLGTHTRVSTQLNSAATDQPTTIDSRTNSLILSEPYSIFSHPLHAKPCSAAHLYPRLGLPKAGLTPVSTSAAPANT